jgi:hypothetical protein
LAPINVGGYDFLNRLLAACALLLSLKGSRPLKNAEDIHGGTGHRGLDEEQGI